MRSSNLSNKQSEDVEKEEFIKKTMTEFENKNITRLDFVQKFTVALMIYIICYIYIFILQFLTISYFFKSI